MKHEDYHNLLEFRSVGGALIPGNIKANELQDSLNNGEVVALIEKTPRDIQFHRCYFSLLNFIYDRMPDNFKSKVKEKDFYQFIKHLQGNYDVQFEFKDGTKMIKYQSISFGNMSQKRFEDLINKQLVVIYEDLIYTLHPQEEATAIINIIEEEYKNFLHQLI